MQALCFAAPFTSVTRTSFAGDAVSTRTLTYQPAQRTITRAELDLIPGVPPGEDARDNAPLRFFVPRPVETYDNRGFATVLPRTWEGEIESIGVSEIEPVTKEDLVKSREIQVDAASTGAFVDYAQMVKEEREAALEELKARSQLGKSGRPTCGEEEGRTFVSNYRTILVEGVKAVEYWGAPNGPVPKLFGGPGA